MANPNSENFLLRALLIVAAGFWVFGPALQGGWLMDDDFYLPQNALLHDPARLWKIWFQPGSLVEYYPIEASLQAIQWQLWQNDTVGYHLTNLVLHLLGALLVWKLLAKFGLRRAWLGGLFFAIHPAVVESVAWISEFKNVLSLPPFLLAMCAWIDYEERGRNRDYLLSLGLFLIAMLCKISMAGFPFVLLLYAWWKRGRVGWNDLKASLPFFLVSLVLGLTTVAVGNWFREAHLQPTAPPYVGGVLSHLALAGLSISFYFFQCVWPVGMLPMYPLWPITPPSAAQFLPWPILIGILGWCWIKRASWGRHALLGLGFFLINLAPFVGFNSVTYMTFTWVMDHFLYLPMIGIIGLGVALLERVDERMTPSLRPVLVGMMTLTMALLAWGSHVYAGMFVNQKKLWTYTVERNPSAWLAHNNLGNALFEAGDVPGAIAQYQAALAIKPDILEAHNNLGLALHLEHRTSEAIDQFELALKGNGHFTRAHVNLGNVLLSSGRTAEAIAQYESALEAYPDDAEARENLAKAKALLKKGATEK